MVDLSRQNDDIGDLSNIRLADSPDRIRRNFLAIQDLSVARPRSERLEALIASSVIPAIAGRHPGSSQSEVQARNARWCAGADASEEFARTVLSGNLSTAKAIISDHLARGMRIDQLYLDLLEPAARWYGLDWVNDDCDFTEVTVGCWRLQQIMHDYSVDFHREVALASHHSARIWLSAVPGEQHTFGVSMLREFFVRAGHEVIGVPSASSNAILETVKREHLDVLGLSVSGSVTSKVLKGLIEAVRAYSRNEAIRILVGGAAIIESPALAAQVGADGAAKGAREALRLIDQWCAALGFQDGI